MRTIYWNDFKILYLITIALFIFLSACSDLRNNISNKSDTANDTDCGASTCHPSTRMNQYPPFSGKHSQHLASGIIIKCLDCHNGYDTYILHRNGVINGFNLYTKAQSTGDIIFFNTENPYASWDNSSDSCYNLLCHGNAGWYTEDNGSDENCSLCHYPGAVYDPLSLNGSGSNGKHIPHVTNQNISCVTCHYNYKENLSHANGQLDTNGESTIVFFQNNSAASWINRSNICSNMDCHGDADWYTTESLTCVQCHPQVKSGSRI